MFLFNLLLVFLIIPIALVIGSITLPLVARFWFIFLLFPLALILFAVVNHFRGPISVDKKDGGAA